MRRRAPLALALLALALAPAGAGAQVLEMRALRPTPTWQERVDAMLEAGEAQEAFDLLGLHLVASPDDPDGNWRAARACYQLGLLTPGQDARNDWYRRGVEHAERALAAAPDDRDVLRWAVATTGSVANAPGVGPRETARAARKAWEHANRLLELHPDDDVGHSALGSLHAEVMTLTTLERFLARAFLGGLVGGASWEAALEHHRRAVELRPTEVLYRVELGKALAWHGLTAEGLEQLEIALSIPARTPVHEVWQAEAREWQVRFLREAAR